MFVYILKIKITSVPEFNSFAAPLAQVISPLKCYNDDYQCYNYQSYFINFINVKNKNLKCRAV